MDSATLLNNHCHCQTLDAAILEKELASALKAQGLAADIRTLRPHLFSSTMVFLSPDTVEQIAEAVSAIEGVMQLAPFQQAALARAPRIAQLPRAAIGVFMGYDFHIAPTGPKLIEINTNAGGALLNLALARAQQACCNSMDRAGGGRGSRVADEEEIFRMFEREWQQERGNVPLKNVLIVDDEPHSQYLAPEFAMFRQLFLRRGLKADIADPRELDWKDGRLWHQGSPVDLVYNRLTDFYLDEAHHHALHEAWREGAVVMTPHPRAHALHAEKTNLVTLSDDALLADWGVSAADRRTLSACIPRTLLVTPANAEALWAGRRKLFFKPVSGFAGRGAYRGDKLTKRVWGEIVQGGHVAQELVHPGERVVKTAGQLAELKFDIRAYTYQGVIQTLAARTYDGQTTNFRTVGGGFAPVSILGDAAWCLVPKAAA